MAELSLRDRCCYLVMGYAPEGVSHAKANEALNEYVEDAARGIALCHDHFVDKAGGFGLFAVATESELKALYELGPLADWDVNIHPLIFSADIETFIYQLDFIMTMYRNQRFGPLFEKYQAGELNQRLDERMADSEFV